MIYTLRLLVLDTLYSNLCSILHAPCSVFHAPRELCFSVPSTKHSYSIGTRRDYIILFYYIQYIDLDLIVEARPCHRLKVVRIKHLIS